MTFTMTSEQRHAVAELVAYNYPQEEADAVANGMEGDPRHIFTAIQALQAWLEGNAQHT